MVEVDDKDGRTSDYPANELSTQPLQPADSEHVGFGTRLISYFIDSFLLFLIGYLIQSALGHDYIAAIWNAKTIGDLTKFNTNNTLINFIGMGTALAYYVCFWAFNDGATPGKKLMGIKVVTVEGNPPDIGVSIVRYIGFVISSFLLGIGFIWIIFDKEKQGLHDKLARTYVVKTGKGKSIGIAVAVIIMMLYAGLMGMIVYKSFSLAAQSARDEMNKGNLNNLTGVTPEDINSDLAADEINVENVVDDSSPLIDGEQPYPIAPDDEIPTIDITVNSLSKEVCIDDCFLYQADKNKIYLIIGMTLENKNKEEVWVSASEFIIRDNEGFVYMTSYAPVEDEFTSVKLPPGTKSRGSLVFEIPSTLPEAKLELSSSYVQGETNIDLRNVN